MLSGPPKDTVLPGITANDATSKVTRGPSSGVRLTTSQPLAEAGNPASHRDLGRRYSTIYLSPSSTKQHTGNPLSPLGAPSRARIRTVLPVNPVGPVVNPFTSTPCLARSSHLVASSVGTHIPGPQSVWSSSAPSCGDTRLISRNECLLPSRPIMQNSASYRKGPLGVSRNVSPAP